MKAHVRELVATTLLDHHRQYSFQTNRLLQHITPNFSESCAIPLRRFHAARRTAHNTAPTRTLFPSENEMYIPFENEHQSPFDATYVFIMTGCALQSAGFTHNSPCASGATIEFRRFCSTFMTRDGMTIRANLDLIGWSTWLTAMCLMTGRNGDCVQIPATE